MTAMGLIPATDPITVELSICQTEDDPSLGIMYNQISRRTLIQQARNVWGEETARDIRYVIDETFKGFSWDREYPREIFLDHQENRIWACCYQRPKRQDPDGEFMVKTTISIPDFLSLEDILPEQCPLFKIEELVEWGNEQTGLVTSRVPLLGLPGYQEDFIKGRVASQQLITLSEQHHLTRTQHLDMRWYLIPTDLKLTSGDLSRRVSRRVFFDNLRGHYPVAKEHIDRLLAYLKHHRIEPHFLVSSVDKQRNLNILYTMDIETSSGEIEVVSGSLNLAQRRRNELQ